MKHFVFILGFIFNIGYLIEALHLPVSGVSLIYLLALIFLALIGTFKDIYISKTYLLFIAFFLLYYTLTFVCFPKTQYSYYKYIMLLAKFPAVMLIPFCIASTYKYFFAGYVSSLLILILLLVTQSGSMLSGSSPDINSRLEAGVLNPIWISRLIFETLLIAGIVLQAPRKYLWLLFILCIPVVYTSGSKGPLLAYLIAYGLYKFRDIKITFQNAMIALSVLLLLGLAFKFTNSLDSNSYFVQRFLRAVPDESSDEMKEMSRVMVWPQTIVKMSQAPVQNLLFGYGVGNFSRLYLDNYSDDRFYPHNMFLELLVEQGLLFLLLTIVLLFFFFKRSVNNFKFILIYYLINAMFSGDIILNEQVFFYLSFAVMSKSILNENTLLNFRKLFKPGYNPVAGNKLV